MPFKVQPQCYGSLYKGLVSPTLGVEADPQAAGPPMKRRVYINGKVGKEFSVKRITKA